MHAPEPTHAPLFDDNPAIIDLLGFGAVAHAVVRVLTSGGLDSVTVGVQSGWGGGKSTLLNLVEKRLELVKHVLVVRIDPWEFENSQDVRGTLIALVLNALQEELVSGEMAVPEGRRKKIIDELDALRRRIAWGRVAQVLVTSAATMTPDIVGLVKALTPAGPETAGEATADKPQSMAGFREDFASLMKQKELGLTKVVVLVDDLDRCLPAAAVATLEAIKLFLSVERMAFVLAADERAWSAPALTSISAVWRTASSPTGTPRRSSSCLSRFPGCRSTTPRRSSRCCSAAVPRQLARTKPPWLSGRGSAGGRDWPPMSSRIPTARRARRPRRSTSPR